MLARPLLIGSHLVNKGITITTTKGNEKPKRVETPLQSHITPNYLLGMAGNAQTAILFFLKEINITSLAD
jgi:hypothetical protein